MQEHGVTLDLEPEDEPTTESDVFYNTEMVTNRDISVACLAVMQERFDKELDICDALAGSGIRGLRYLDEIDGVGQAILNDMNPTAVDNIRTNLDLNNIDTDRVSITNRDANAVMTANHGQLDFVDLDPFGSPAPYLDSAARSLFRDSCIGVTATDLAPLFGSYREVCERRYGSTPLKNKFSHETGPRILLKEVFETLARYDFAFEPLLCHYERHYYRIFGRVRESKQTCNRLRDTVGYLQFCRDCGWRDFAALNDTVQQCPRCDETLFTAGPLWTGIIADEDFAVDVHNWLTEQGYENAADLVEAVRDECRITTPFYDTHELGSVLDTEAPRKQDLIDTLQERGYRATETHFTPKGVRTDAPLDTIAAIVQD
jgi:tRNA (guanine26-N2/guanine27-N2)-dimethyltransferase